VIKRFRFLHHFILPPPPRQPDSAAVQHKRFFIYRSRANLDGSTHASEAATNKQKILCTMRRFT
jgi:hypothetical protein